MSYAQQRKASAEAEQTEDVLDYSWEEQNTALLHSGFSEPTNTDPPRSRLAIFLYHDMGRYRVRLSDRTTHEHAFITLSSLGTLFQDLEALLQSNDLDWRHDKQSQNGYKGS